VYIAVNKFVFVFIYVIYVFHNVNKVNHLLSVILVIHSTPIEAKIIGVCLNCIMYIFIIPHAIRRRNSNLATFGL